MSRGAVLAAAPVLLVQGSRVRRRVEWLPEAPGVDGQVGRGGDRLEVLVVGDSVAAGVGVAHHRDAMAGRLAAHLNARTGRPVHWRVVARSGLDARGLHDLLAETDLGDPDVAVVSLGVNDTKDLRSDAAWRAGLTKVLDRLVALPRARVFVLAMPPVERFPALPRPLADLLGARARRLDRIARELALEYDAVARVELTGRDLDELAEPFASDGFHPGPALHDLVARGVAERLTLAQLMRRSG
ncbi:MAG TPA: SGNH/GDSL hydrolase family protein [Marmoricola sp.]|nr:SGNH/GDSL hydrolase family protein [Marmoricola sp.]